LLLIAILVGLGAMTAVRLITRTLNRLTTPPERRTTYECGEPPVGRAWFRFNNRFYRIAIVFLACDTLLALLMPILPRLGMQAMAGHGALALTALLVVVGAIGLIVAYATAKGDFVWDKTVAHTKAAARNGVAGREISP
jgi:NADH-quinone oxidoreductase subunit A